MSGKKKKIALPKQVAASPVPKLETGYSWSVPKWAIIALLIFTAVVYAHALKGSIVFIDDDEYLIKNPYIRNFSLEGVRSIFTSFYEFNYHPLTTLTWLIEYRFFGLDAFPYHLTNVLLHLANTWLVYTLAARLSGKNMTGLIVAALFALHPMHVETVAWISDRKGLLCALFYFLSLLYYLRYVDKGLKRKQLGLCLLFFVASLLSKSAAVTLPVVILVIDVYRSRAITGASVMEKLPFLLLSVLFGVLAIMSQGKGAINDITADYGILNRIVIFIAGIAFYFVKVVVPVHLSAIHYFPKQTDGHLPWIYYASLPFLLFVYWIVRRRFSLRREVVFGIVFFLAAISVMLQIITVGSAYASERYSYVSYFGFFYIAGQWFSGINISKRSMAAAVAALVLVVFSIVSWQRMEVWRSTESVFADIIAKNEGNPNNYLVFFHWGDYYQSQGRMEQALEQFDKALELKPDYQRAHLRRGETYDAMGNAISAIMDYNEVLKVNPRSAVAYNDKGWAYFEMGDKVQARINFDSAIAIDDKMALAYNNRGWLTLQEKDSVRALKDFDKAVLHAPLFPKPYYNRALIKMFTGDKKGAIADYSKLIEIEPSNGIAYYYRGMANLDLNNRAAARADFKMGAMLGNRDAEDVLRKLDNR